MTDKIFNIYQKRKNDFENDLTKAKKQSNLLVFFCSLIALVVIGSIVYGVRTKMLFFVLYGGPPILFFLILVIKHHQINKRINFLQNLVQINETALLRLSGKWTSFLNSGNRFINPDHPYSTDLNIFGQGSLFQHINATTSFMGNQALAKILNKHPNYEEILSRQQAVKELAYNLDWRQHLQATGMNNVHQGLNPAQLLAWAEGKPLIINNRYIYLIRLLPVITVSFIILWILHIIPLYLPVFTLIIQLAIVIFSEKTVRQAFGAAGKAVAELECYSSLLKCIESKDFRTPLLGNLKQKLFINKQPSSYQIKVLSKIADRISLRYSQIHFFINIAVFWDLFTLKKLERWKIQSGISMRVWLDVIGDFEALSTLAGLAHDNPEWVFPEVTNSPPAFEAVSLGHPLINNDIRVCNDVSLSGPGTVFVITGSNMSGKSTFLRTIGINLVLAYAGAPVCARVMRCSLMNVYSSMQVHDNLEYRISTFYAELKRIKTIVDAAKLGKPIIFLLDEIFKGTNSKDRIFGAKAVIGHLCGLSAIGLITTHDLDLGVLEKEIPRCVRNYHFTDTITDNQIYFDYRLKPGISQTTNAIALMKMIGIT